MQVDARRVGRWRFITLRREVDNSRDIADLDINLDLMPDKDRTVVQLALTGSLTVTDRAALDACLDKYARLFACARVCGTGTTDIAVVPADGEFDDLGIGGFAAAAVDELVATARDRRATPRTPGRRWRCCCGWPTRRGRREAASAGPDQLPRNHPPRDRVSRPRRRRDQRRQRDRQVVDDRGAGPAAGSQGPLDARRKSSRSSPPTPMSAPRSPPKSPPALTVSCTASGSTSVPRRS